MLAAIGGVDTAVYKVLFLLHILAVVVGFGSSFVWPVLGAQARNLGPGEASLALSRTAVKYGKVLTTGAIYLAALFGILLVVFSGETWKFSQTWVSAAFLLFIVGAVLGYLLTANNKKMLDIQERLASGEITGGPGGPPPEVAQMADLGKRSAMFGGLAHLIFLLLLVDMIWKPGLG